MGPALARRRPLRRHGRLLERLRAFQRLALSRLRHPQLQRRQALRPLHHRADRRRRTRRRLGASETRRRRGERQAGEAQGGLHARGERVDRRHRVPPHGALGQRDGEVARGPTDLPRRRGQLRRPVVPLDDDALPEVPRPQVRPDPDPRLLPDVRRLRGHADGRAARAVPRSGEPRRVRRGEDVRRADARLRGRREDDDREEAGGRRAGLVPRTQPRSTSPRRPARSSPTRQKPPRNVGLDHVDEGQLKVREQDEWIWKRSLERYQPLAQSVYNGPDLDYSWDNARLPPHPGRFQPEVAARRAPSTRAGRWRPRASRSGPACSAPRRARRRRASAAIPTSCPMRSKADGSGWRDGSPTRATR